MKVYNKDKTEILEEYDLSLGYLVNDILVKHIDRVEPVEEKGHYAIVKTYDNGGRDIKWVVDVEKVEEVEEHDVEEQVQVYIPYTELELSKILNNKKIQDLKDYLKDTDYVVVKMCEEFVQGGSIVNLLKDYKNTLSKRKDARKQINELEENNDGEVTTN